MKKLLLATVTVLCCCIIATGPAFAKTLILGGTLDGTVAMRQGMEFAVNKGPVSTFTFRFALPATFHTHTVTQSIEGLETQFTPRPVSSVVETDRFGNRFQKVVWENVDQDIRVRLEYNAILHTVLADMTSKAPFPLGGEANGEQLYLQATDLVQSNASSINELARRLTNGARSEYEAVTAITNWVADQIKYTFNPPQYDAAYTLATHSGNCQNFAHLSIALLRSVGIPARIVGGITLKDAWKVPIDAKNAIVQSMGQGGHAWLEVWFPDLGWLPYDPQQSKQFTSTRHIKQTQGVDSRDINDTWRGGPYLPAYSEVIEGHYSKDNIHLKMERFTALPRPYLLSNLIAAAGGGTREPGPRTTTRSETMPSRPSKPAPPTAGSGAGPARTEFVGNGGPEFTDDEETPLFHKPLKPGRPAKPSTTHRKPVPGARLVFGNMEFPTLVTLYNVRGNIGTRIFERETSEYVTSRHIYAQAFFVRGRMTLDHIALAMHKFGGDGAVYIDVVRDKGGKPDIMQGIRSNLLDLERIPRNKPGYYWVEFSFPPADGYKPQELAPGKYWIVLRASGEAIMNWFFTPGKPYSGSDDTRSTAKGFQWEDILNYDFVFKVTGRAL